MNSSAKKLGAISPIWVSMTSIMDRYVILYDSVVNKGIVQAELNPVQQLPRKEDLFAPHISSKGFPQVWV